MAAAVDEETVEKEIFNDKQLTQVLELCEEIKSGEARPVVVAGLPGVGPLLARGLREAIKNKNKSLSADSQIKEKDVFAFVDWEFREDRSGFSSEKGVENSKESEQMLQGFKILCGDDKEKLEKLKIEIVRDRVLKDNKEATEGYVEEVAAGFKSIEEAVEYNPDWLKESSSLRKASKIFSPKPDIKDFDEMAFRFVGEAITLIKLMNSKVPIIFASGTSSFITENVSMATENGYDNLFCKLESEDLAEVMGWVKLRTVNEVNYYNEDSEDLNQLARGTCRPLAIDYVNRMPLETTMGLPIAEPDNVFQQVVLNVPLTPKEKEVFRGAMREAMEIVERQYSSSEFKEESENFCHKLLVAVSPRARVECSSAAAASAAPEAGAACAAAAAPAPVAGATVPSDQMDRCVADSVLPVVLVAPAGAVGSRGKS